MLLGCHLSIAGGAHNALLLAQRYGLEAVAMFVRNQRQWRAPALSQEEADLFRQTRSRTNIRLIVAHGSYLVNLAGLPEIRQKSIVATADELARCGRLGIEYLVMHPGSSADIEGGIIHITDALNEIIGRDDLRTDRPGPMILLESTAGQGNCLGCSLEQLAAMLDRLRRPERFGLCLDTCHLLAAGYDFRTAGQYETLMAQVDRLIGIERVRAIHLNDSVKGLGSRVDRHAHIGRGEIGCEGFSHFVNDPLLADVPMILETPKGQTPDGEDLDEINIEAIRRLVH